MMLSRYVNEHLEKWAVRCAITRANILKRMLHGEHINVDLNPDALLSQLIAAAMAVGCDDVAFLDICRQAGI